MWVGLVRVSLTSTRNVPQGNKHRSLLARVEVSPSFIHWVKTCSKRRTPHLYETAPPQISHHKIFIRLCVQTFQIPTSILG